MCGIFLARLDEPGVGFEVVIAVRHPESAGQNLGDDLGRIVIVRTAEHFVHAGAIEVANQLIHAAFRLVRLAGGLFENHSQLLFS